MADTIIKAPTGSGNKLVLQTGSGQAGIEVSDGADILLHKKDEFLKLSLCGLASLLIFQTFIHIGVNISLLPTTGMTLPFLSYGGSSLIGSAILAGVIINYTKNEIQTDEK